MKSDIGIVSEIGLGLSKLKNGEYYQYPEDISPDRINRVLNLINSTQISIMDDANGCDMDWSLIDDLIFMDSKYHVWGCITSGSLMFQKQ